MIQVPDKVVQARIVKGDRFFSHLCFECTCHSAAFIVRGRMVSVCPSCVQDRLASLEEGNDSPHAEKIRHTLEDNLKTCHDRLANYHKAEANGEFVQLETHRIENKIKTLAEIAINRQEPDFVSRQVDEVAASMLETERTMNELQFVTGLSQLDEAVPNLLGTRARVAE